MEMANSSATQLLVALLCVSAFAATRTSMQSVTSLDHVGVCESIVESQGYTCEEHKVITEDGYILGLQRIPNGRSGNETADKLPVLLQHGLLLDASSWMLNSPDQDLPFILADNGFDVWIANTRGTKSSRGHTSLSPNDAAYWDWSWDELAAFELPVIVQYVNKQTGQKLHYVGHSLGTLTALAALSEGKLVKLLRSAALLSPVAYLGLIPSPIIRAAFELYLEEATEFLGFPYAPNRQLTQLVELICRTAGIACSNLLSALVGPNCCLSSAGLDNLYKYFPQPTATKNFVHLAQMIRRGTIEMHDYGDADANMEHYKQFTPPVYNMKNILKDFPLFLSNGGTDLLSDVNDVKRLLNDLRDHDKDKLIVLFIPGYAHLDFIMARNANQFVYEPLMAFFKSH